MSASFHTDTTHTTMSSSVTSGLSGMSLFNQGALDDENPEHGVKRQFGENSHAELTATGLGDHPRALDDGNAAADIRTCDVVA